MGLNIGLAIAGGLGSSITQSRQEAMDDAKERRREAFQLYMQHVVPMYQKRKDEAENVERFKQRLGPLLPGLSEDQLNYVGYSYGQSEATQTKLLNDIQNHNVTITGLQQEAQAKAAVPTQPVQPQGDIGSNDTPEAGAGLPGVPNNNAGSEDTPEQGTITDPTAAPGAAPSPTSGNGIGAGGAATQAAQTGHALNQPGQQKPLDWQPQGPPQPQQQSSNPLIRGYRHLLMPNSADPSHDKSELAKMLSDLPDEGFFREAMTGGDPLAKYKNLNGKDLGVQVQYKNLQDKADREKTMFNLLQPMYQNLQPSQAAALATASQEAINTGDFSKVRALPFLTKEQLAAIERSTRPTTPGEDLVERTKGEEKAGHLTHAQGNTFIQETVDSANTVGSRVVDHSVDINGKPIIPSNAQADALSPDAGTRTPVVDGKRTPRVPMMPSAPNAPKTNATVKARVSDAGETKQIQDMIKAGKAKQNDDGTYTVTIGGKTYIARKK